MVPSRPDSGRAPAGGRRGPAQSRPGHASLPPRRRGRPGPHGPHHPREVDRGGRSWRGSPCCGATCRPRPPAASRCRAARSRSTTWSWRSLCGQGRHAAGPGDGGAAAAGDGDLATLGRFYDLLGSPAAGKADFQESLDEIRTDRWRTQEPDLRDGRWLVYAPRTRTFPVPAALRPLPDVPPGAGGPPWLIATWSGSGSGLACRRPTCSASGSSRRGPVASARGRGRHRPAARARAGRGHRRGLRARGLRRVRLHRRAAAGHVLPHLGRATLGSGAAGRGHAHRGRPEGRPADPWSWPGWTRR